MDPLFPEVLESPVSQTPESPQKKSKPLFPIVMVIAVLLILFFVMQEETLDTDLLPSQEEVTNENGSTASNSDSVHFVDDVLSPEEFEGIEKAEYIINSNQGKEKVMETYETLEFGIVADEQIENAVYFTTSALQTSEQKMFVGVYQYDTETFRWQRLYKNTYSANEDESYPLLRVIGKEGSTLFLFKDVNDREMEECESLWLLADDEVYSLWTLDTKDLYAGLSTYELPEERRADAQEKVAGCVE